MIVFTEVPYEAARPFVLRRQHRPGRGSRPGRDHRRPGVALARSSGGCRRAERSRPGSRAPRGARGAHRRPRFRRGLRGLRKGLARRPWLSRMAGAARPQRGPGAAIVGDGEHPPRACRSGRGRRRRSAALAPSAVGGGSRRGQPRAASRGAGAGRTAAGGCGAGPGGECERAHRLGSGAHARSPWEGESRRGRRGLAPPGGNAGTEPLPRDRRQPGTAVGGLCLREAGS